jgi:hypothetical protein
MGLPATAAMAMVGIAEAAMKLRLRLIANWFDKNRLADWFEKVSAAFLVGAVLTQNNAVAALVFSVVCLLVSQFLAKRG